MSETKVESLEQEEVTKNENAENNPAPRQFSTKAKLKITLASLFGFFTFFITFSVKEDGQSTILVDHLANFVRYVLSFLGRQTVAWV